MSLFMFSCVKENVVTHSSNDAVISKNLKASDSYMEYKLGMLALREQYLPQNRPGDAPAEPGNDNGQDNDKLKIANADAEGALSGAKEGTLLGHEMGTMIGFVYPTLSSTAPMFGRIFGYPIGALVGAVFGSIKEFQKQLEEDSTSNIAIINDPLLESDLSLGNHLMANIGLLHNRIIWNLNDSNLVFRQTSDAELLAAICNSLPLYTNVQLSDDTIEMIVADSLEILSDNFENVDFDPNLVQQIIDDYFVVVSELIENEIPIRDFTMDMMQLVEETWTTEDDIVNAIVANSAISVGYHSISLWHIIP